MSTYALSLFRWIIWSSSLVLCAVGPLCVAGCTTTLAFSDSLPIAIVGNPPPPPPSPDVVKAPPPRPPPPPPPSRVEVTEDKIVIHDKIQFEVDKAIIKPESFGLLDEIGAVITANPRIRRLSVEGHTDSTGSDGHNQQLSDARAHSVLEFLVQHGIAPDRLVSKGWGESKPLANNATAIGREHNRRVEFVIIEQSDIKRTYEIDPKTGERRLVAPPDAPASTSPQTKGPPEPEPEPEPEYDDRPETVL